jgi:hypothetical protein
MNAVEIFEMIHFYCKTCLFEHFCIEDGIYCTGAEMNYLACRMILDGKY